MWSTYQKAQSEDGIQLPSTGDSVILRHLILPVKEAIQSEDADDERHCVTDSRKRETNDEET